jgi:hypothetical protein
MDDFTVEETNLICITDAENRTALIEKLSDLLSETDEREMRDIAESAVRKLKRISDAEYEKMKFYLA